LLACGPPAPLPIRAAAQIRARGLRAPRARRSLLPLAVVACTEQALFHHQRGQRAEPIKLDRRRNTGP
jgi:hypothetical protein